MKRYDIKCPICGTVNCNLDLEETNGWMECEKCGNTTQTPGFGPIIRIPVFCSYKDYKIAKSEDHQAAG